MSENSYSQGEDNIDLKKNYYYKTIKGFFLFAFYLSSIHLFDKYLMSNSMQDCHDYSNKQVK